MQITDNVTSIIIQQIAIPIIAVSETNLPPLGTRKQGRRKLDDKNECSCLAGLMNSCSE